MSRDFNFRKPFWRLMAVSSYMIMGLASAAADESRCYIKDGDKWCFYGDSITAAGVYTRAVEQVFRHFHPEARVTFINNAMGGKKASEATAADAGKGDPNIVSIMLGMNDAINSPWQKGLPVEPVLAAYRANLTRLVKDLKAAGREVILMTPTLTDETIGVTIFRLEGTMDLLRQMGRICEEVAKDQHVPCLPIQEEFERLQDQMPLREQRLRYDGVHPTSIGQYQMARILWNRLNLAAPLTTGKRELFAPAAELKIEAAVEQHLQPADDVNFSIIFNSAVPVNGKIAWSGNGKPMSENILINGKTPWRPSSFSGFFPVADGKANLLVVDVEDNGRRSVFLVDIMRNPLLHMKDGLLSGHIKSERNPGKPVCDYLFRKEGDALYFEASVFDSDLVVRRKAVAWPWSGDSLTLYLDLRPTSRFGGIGLERDVYQLWFQPQNTHGFSPGFRPWYGKGIEHAACPFGEKTAGGYKVGLLIDGWFTLQERFDLSAHDYIGFDLSVVACNAEKGNAEYHSLRKTQLPTFVYASGFAVIDLKGKNSGDSIFTVNIFPQQKI